KYCWLRPTLFHSLYEAAAHFIIGHRISMAQGRRIREWMAHELGVCVDVGGETFPAFPDPPILLGVSSFPGLNSTKIERLHGVAEAALSGLLDRDRLRSLPVQDALVGIWQLPGVGPFFAAGILNRGAGVADEITEDDLTRYAFQQL